MTYRRGRLFRDAAPGQSAGSAGVLELSLSAAQNQQDGASRLEKPRSVPGGCQIDGLGESSDGPDLPPGTMQYPACSCRQHRHGRGRPDSSVRLSATADAQDQGPETVARRRFVVTRSGLAAVVEKPTGGSSC